MNYSYLKKWYDEVHANIGSKVEPFEVLFEEPVGKNDVIVDTHGHTTYSDGKRSSFFYHEQAENSARLYDKTSQQKHGFRHGANEKSRALIGSSDHDSIGADNGFNGVEVTCRLNGQQIEILVYNFDYNKAKQLINSHEFPYLDRSFKIKRILTLLQKRIDKVNEMNLTDKPLTINHFVSIELEKNKENPKKQTFLDAGLDFNKIYTPGNQIPEYVNINGQEYKINFDFFNSKLFSYINNSENGKNFLKSIEEKTNAEKALDFGTFQRLVLTNPEGELYVDDAKYWPTAEQVIDFAQKADGISVLAHPFGYGGIKYSPFELMENLRKLGVKGIEAFHGFNEPDEIEFIYKYCQFYGLLATMGSDTHEYYSNQGGRVNPGIAPGKGGESRFGKDNKIDESSLGTYNFHYFGTGAWRGEKEYDNMAIPETAIEHINQIKKKIEARELANQKLLQKLQNATTKQSQPNQ